MDVLQQILPQISNDLGLTENLSVVHQKERTIPRIEGTNIRLLERMRSGRHVKDYCFEVRFYVARRKLTVRIFHIGTINTLTQKRFERAQQDAIVFEQYATERMRQGNPPRPDKSFTARERRYYLKASPAKPMPFSSFLAWLSSRCPEQPNSCRIERVEEGYRVVHQGKEIAHVDLGRVEDFKQARRLARIWACHWEKLKAGRKTGTSHDRKKKVVLPIDSLYFTKRRRKTGVYPCIELRLPSGRKVYALRNRNINEIVASIRESLSMHPDLAPTDSRVYTRLRKQLEELRDCHSS